MAQHTPGPWHAVTIYGTRAEVVAETRPWEKSHRLAVIAKVEGDPNWGDAHAERDANANLIAAAPDLLAMLREVAPHLQQMGPALPHDVWDRLWKVIDRAEGVK